MIQPGLQEFIQLSAKQSVVPVWAEILGDLETPLSAYWKLAHDEPNSFLLESVTGGEQVARYSFLGVRPRSLERGTISDRPELLDFVRQIPGIAQEALAGLPPFIGGAVGMIGFDYVHSIESLPSKAKDDLRLDDVAMMVVDSVVVFDHAKNKIWIVSLAEGSQNGYDSALAEIQRIQSRLSAPLPPLPTGRYEKKELSANRSQDDFENAVRRIKDYIVEGDCFQCVPSVRFSTQLDAHPVAVYRALRSLNPSPYMYLIQFDDFQIVGASPELLVSLKSGIAAVRPIAGTRPRADDPAIDEQLAVELLSDEKERAEHLMLIDLGRNDLGKVSKYGSVEVHDLMQIERYSHVMHIVSSVSGHLKPGLDGIDLLRACFPAGTVSGAPKVRAMEIIDELEPTRRGLYAGAVGFFSATGDLDLAIAIRTILIKDGMAHVQAGAGIVFDSDPTLEWNECKNKARACLQAIELAQAGL